MNHDLSKYEYNYAQNLNVYVEVPADITVNKGDTFTESRVLPATEPKPWQRRRAPKPERRQNLTFTVTGFGQSFIREDGVRVVRCYGNLVKEG